MRKLTKHHMIPRSRGGPDESWNIKFVSMSKHEAWHTLFGNKTPIEIIDHILEEWTPKKPKKGKGDG